MQNETGSIKVPLVFEAGHMFVKLPEGKFLVDTGVNLSFGTTGHITYGNVRHPLPIEAGYSMDDLEPMDLNCDGLIGMDLINSTPVLWDGPRGIAEIGATDVPPEACTTRIRNNGHPACMAFPFVNARIGDHELLCLFDTGAQCGYARLELFQGDSNAGEIDDYSPLIKSHIHTQLWLEPSSIGEAKIIERFGVPNGKLQTILNAVRIEAIIGCSWMSEHKVWFNHAESRISIV